VPSTHVPAREEEGEDQINDKQNPIFFQKIARFLLFQLDIKMIGMGIKGNVEGDIHAKTKDIQWTWTAPHIQIVVSDFVLMVVCHFNLSKIIPKLVKRKKIGITKRRRLRASLGSVAINATVTCTTSQNRKNPICKWIDQMQRSKYTRVWKEFCLHNK
jgi:hypothetical protein